MSDTPTALSIVALVQGALIAWLGLTTRSLAGELKAQSLNGAAQAEAISEVTRDIRQLEAEIMNLNPGWVPDSAAKVPFVDPEIVLTAGGNYTMSCEAK